MHKQANDSNISSEILASARVEYIVDDFGVPETELLKLFRAAFGGADSLWPANQRWLLWHSGQLLGHVSVQRRWFIVNQRYFEGWFVGGVCVSPTAQRSGIGTLLMRQAHTALAAQALRFAVLNCGDPVVGFYARVGYVKISERALYMRNGNLVIDADPALAISFVQGTDVSDLKCEAFPFGFDF